MTAWHASTAAALVLVAAALVACSSSPSLGPPSPTGATAIPGGPMESIPVPASPKIPTSQQEAQDTLTAYLQKTVDALPKGTSLDGTRYIVGDGTAYCEDNPSGPDAPVHVEDWRDMNLPPGTDFNAIISQTGDIWKQWGWKVIERDGFTKPNRFGYGPDGYILQIEARPDPKFPPSLVGSSPCFSGNLKSNRVTKPSLIQQAPQQ
ncbi:hypothetical protein [Mycolicibacterium sphagni]|nr:hypothetical protein [Mycolicibacterium sphagni]